MTPAFTPDPHPDLPQVGYNDGRKMIMGGVGLPQPEYDVPRPAQVWMQVVWQSGFKERVRCGSVLHCTAPLPVNELMTEAQNVI